MKTKDIDTKEILGNELYYALEEVFGDDTDALNEIYSGAIRAMRIINEDNEFGGTSLEHPNFFKHAGHKNYKDINAC
jgi:hypothetical protein